MPDLKLNDKFTHMFAVTDTVYKGFINTFNDTNPLHTDAQFAIGHGFKDRIMHGNILNGFLSFFIGECLPVKQVVIHSQEIQFKNAVYINDELFFEASVTRVYESVKTVQFKYIFKNKESKTVAKGMLQIGILI